MRYVLIYDILSSEIFHSTYAYWQLLPSVNTTCMDPHVFITANYEGISDRIFACFWHFAEAIIASDKSDTNTIKYVMVIQEQDSIFCPPQKENIHCSG